MSTAVEFLARRSRRKICSNKLNLSKNNEIGAYWELILQNDNVDVEIEIKNIIEEMFSLMLH